MRTQGFEKRRGIDDLGAHRCCAHCCWNCRDGVEWLFGAGDIRQQASDLVEQVVESGTEQITNAVAGDVFTAEGINNAYAAISDKVGANPMQVVAVKIAPGVLVVEAINPNVPTELNEWSFLAGTVRNPVPIDYAGDTEALQQNLFAVNEVPALGAGRRI
ncbi:hypothetical protein [Mycobacterium sp. C31M]